MQKIGYQHEKWKNDRNSTHDRDWTLDWTGFDDFSVVEKPRVSAFQWHQNQLNIRCPWNLHIITGKQWGKMSYTAPFETGPPPIECFYYFELNGVFPGFVRAILLILLIFRKWAIWHVRSPEKRHSTRNNSSIRSAVVPSRTAPYSSFSIVV